MSSPTWTAPSRAAVVGRSARRTWPPKPLEIAAGILFVTFAAIALWTMRDGVHDWDEGVFWETLRALSQGEPLFRSVYTANPPVFYALMLPFWLAGHSILALRLGILFYALLGLAAAYAAGRITAGHGAGLFAALLLAGSPLYLHQASIVQVEAPAIALALAAVVLALATGRAQPRAEPWLAAAAGIALTLAIGTKLSGTLAAVPVAIALLAVSGRRWLRVAACAAGAVVGLGIVALMVSGSWSQAFSELVTHHTAAGILLDRPIGANLKQVVLTRELPLDALAIAGAVVALLRRDVRSLALVAWAAVTAVAILFYQPLWPHHLALLAPCLALVAATGLGPLASDLRTRVGAGIVVAVFGSALIGMAFAARDVEHAPSTSAYDRTVAGALVSATRPGEKVITDDLFIAALAGRDVPPSLTDTSADRIHSGLLTTAQIASIADHDRIHTVLVDSGRLSQLPGFLDWLQGHFRLARSFGSGRAIYTR